MQPPAAPLHAPPKLAPATTLCPPAAFPRHFRFRFQTIPHPRGDPASTFHHKAAFWFSPSLLLHHPAVAPAAAWPPLCLGEG